MQSAIYANDYKAYGVHTRMRVLHLTLIVVFSCVGMSDAQTVRPSKPLACACEIDNTFCLTNRQMAQHAIHIEMEPDRLGSHSNYNGVAVFQIRFNAKGRMTGADAISGHPLGISHLMAAVSKWRFRPVKVSGARRSACGKLSINFAMKENVPSAEVVNKTKLLSIRTYAHRARYQESSKSSARPDHSSFQLSAVSFQLVHLGGYGNSRHISDTIRSVSRDPAFQV
jgi:hypothetical protein